MKKYIVLCLIISIMMAPIVEAQQEDYEPPVALKVALIATFAVSVFFIIIRITRYMNRSDEEKELQREYDLERAVYYDNWYSVLSWAKEGMDESTIQDKIGTERARGCLQSTHSSMGSTVSTYAFPRESYPGSGYYKGSIWLTFIDGKLSSISTFNR